VSEGQKIQKLELENEALRTHLRLALSTIRDPIPETVYLRTIEEACCNEESKIYSSQIAPDWKIESKFYGEDIWDDYEDWGDPVEILGEECDFLNAEFLRWKSKVVEDTIA
jgi:hypothetical protein